MKWTMEIPDDVPAPKRGDLLQSSIGDTRERTWFVLRAREMRCRTRKRKFMIFRARWWELEPEMRLRLFASAERNGGQRVWQTWAINKRAKRKIDTFEQFMRRAS